MLEVYLEGYMNLWSLAMKPLILLDTILILMGETVLQIINNIKHEFCVGGILLCIVLTLVSTGMDIFNFLSNHASFPLL